MQNRLLKDTLFLAILAAVIGGTTPVAAKIALEVIPPFTLSFIRFFLAALILTPLVIRFSAVSFSGFRKTFLTAFIGAVNPMIVFTALLHTQASVTPLIFAGVPAMTALYFYFVNHSRLSPRQTLGMTLGFSGVFMIVGLPLLQSSANAPLALGGNTLLFLGAILFTLYGILSKKIQNTLGVSPVALAYYLCLVGTLISAPFALHEIMQHNIFADLGIKHVFSAVFIGIIGTAGFFVIYQHALKTGSEVSATLFMYIQPVATIGLAYIFLGEQLAWPFFLGGGLALIGAQLASKK
jgi:drug/metabolite transporter (DMT)-like permease